MPTTYIDTVVQDDRVSTEWVWLHSPSLSLCGPGSLGGSCLRSWGLV